MRLAVLNDYDWTCANCGEFGDEVDHIIPMYEARQRGIADLDERNLQVLCRGCHIDKTIDERARVPGLAARKRWYKEQWQWSG